MPGVYFAYRDGALGFSCVRCDKRCCSGTWATDPATEATLPQHPRLALFARAAQNATRLRVVEQMDERCGFLANDGLCSLHRQGGREAKPLGCRLFPAFELHWMARIDTVVVVPQVLHCPLEVAGPEDLSLLDHATAEGDIARARGHLPTTDSSLPAPSWPVDLLDLEIDCRDALSVSPEADYIDHLARQLVRSAYHLAGRSTERLAVQDVANARADLLVHLGLVAELLGATPPPALTPRSTACLVAMTGTLRFRALSALSSYPYEVAIERAPFVLSVIAWFAAHHLGLQREIRGEEDHALTPSTVGRLWSRFSALALLMSQVFSVPFVESPALPAGAPPDMEDRLRRFVAALAADEEARRAFLAAGMPDTHRPRLLKDYLAQAVRDQADRVPFIRAVAEHLPMRFHTI